MGLKDWVVHPLFDWSTSCFFHLTTVRNLKSRYSDTQVKESNVSDRESTLYFGSVLANANHLQE